MAKKSAAATNGTVEGIETAFKNGTEAFRASFDKAVKNYDQVLGYGKDTVAAYVKSANAAGKGAESFHNELYAFSKQSIEDSIAATKAMLGSKSVHEAIELQTDFAKSAFDAYVGEVTKLSELMVSATRQSMEPLQSRFQAWVEVVQSARAE